MRAPKGRADRRRRPDLPVRRRRLAAVGGVGEPTPGRSSAPEGGPNGIWKIGLTPDEAPKSEAPDDHVLTPRERVHTLWRRGRRLMVRALGGGFEHERPRSRAEP